MESQRTTIGFDISVQLFDDKQEEMVLTKKLLNVANSNIHHNHRLNCSDEIISEKIGVLTLVNSEMSMNKNKNDIHVKFCITHTTPILDIADVEHCIYAVFSSAYSLDGDFGFSADGKKRVLFYTLRSISTPFNIVFDATP
jgi:hypothetical protein